MARWVLFVFVTDRKDKELDIWNRASEDARRLAGERKNATDFVNGVSAHKHRHRKASQRGRRGKKREAKPRKKTYCET